MPTIAELNTTTTRAAALARHRALLAAGCLSPVGVRRVGAGKRDEEEEAGDDE